MDDLTQEDIFLKRKSVSIYEALGYTGGVAPPDTTLKKQLKQLIETCLLVEVSLKDAKKAIFVIK